MRSRVVAISCVLAAALAAAPPAWAAFPYGGGGTPAAPSYHTNPGQVPSDLGDNDWKYAATPEDDNPPVNSQQSELCGVRGASLVDEHTAWSGTGCAPAGVKTAWTITTGRPDVTIAVLDSGIKWNDAGAMDDLRMKVRLNRGELPTPNHGGAALVSGVRCGGYASADDANGDGLFNLLDFACDERIHLTDARRAGPANTLVPQDLLIAFSDGDDDDGNGFADDIAGWDFLDDDNDAFDDVQYGHGTGEARDSTAEASNGGDAGSCPNCVVVPLRVGDSFVADVNRFAQATLYAVDNGALVIQEALGTLNYSKLARDAVDYAYDHGVTVMASAADEAAQHHNWPSSLPHVIVVNSVRNPDEVTPLPNSYLRFNGCTNFSSKISLAIPSTSCSSNAVGLAAGMAGLVYSAALNAHEASPSRLPANGSCHRIDGSACMITPNEVGQLMAAGEVGSTPQADDVNFASGNGSSEPVCGGQTPAPPLCTDPNNPALRALVDAAHPVLPGLVATRAYPARKGHDQFYGYGRVNMWNAVHAVDAGDIPPEVSIESPDWYAQVDPGQAGLDLRGRVAARGAAFTCRVLVAPGSYPNDDKAPAGDFVAVPSPGVCDGSSHTAAIDGTLARVSVATLKSLFPATVSDFGGPESDPANPQTSNGRPNIDKYGFTVKVVATAAAGTARTGEDRRNLYLHRDTDLLPGFPKRLAGDAEASPLLVDLDGDNRNELVLAGSDGLVHAWRPNGSELPGWPARGDALPLHAGGRAFSSGAVDAPPGGAFLASPAAADLNGDGVPEVLAADFEGKVYAWNADGSRRWTREANPAYSGKPLAPFVNVRQGQVNRTQHGFLGSPVVADLDGDRRPEVVAAAMDRHVYAWHGDDATTVPGFPMLVVDRSKVASIDPDTHAVKFKDGVGAEFNQGAIVDTPAVGDITGDDKPEIVVGTNEEYAEDPNAGNFALAQLGPVAEAAGLKGNNSRLFALKSTGEPGGPVHDNGEAYVSGWPFAVARLLPELLPVVGEGITGSPVIGPASMDCGGNGGAGPKVGVIPDAGLGYVLNKDTTSCAGSTAGKPNAMRTENTVGTDHPAIPAVGHPVFADFAGGTSFLAPAAGLLRALDLAASEYQTGGEDYVAAWNPASGDFRPNFPVRMNDLQFLTGPSVADIDPGSPGEEMVAGSAYLDLQAYTGRGTPVAGFPKLTADWMVANPLIGSFGSLDKKVVVAANRDGRVFAYRTGADACAAGSWPRFHHDNANSGAYDRDAVAPGTPYGDAVEGATVKFKAPGDDLLCGTLAAGEKGARYEAVQSAAPITAANFAAAEKIDAPATGAPPGTTQALALPANPKRYVAIRAVDEQGNAGRPLVVRAPKPKGGHGA